MVRNCLHGWPANERWTMDNLSKRFKHTLLKIGEDDDGRKIRCKFKYFADYMRHTQDDSPLYLFETGLDYSPEAATLLDDYSVPDLFPYDYLNLCSREHKPPFRWFCVGPERSGTTLHKDPLATNAWNAVTSGLKRWVVMDPAIPRPIARGTKHRKKGDGSEAIDYFDKILPKIKLENPGLEIY